MKSNIEDIETERTKMYKKMFYRYIVLQSTFLFALIFLFTHTVSGQKPIFRASVVKVDITPEDSQDLIGYRDRKSSGIRDRIFHRIVALDDGTSQFFLVSTEVCIISPLEYDQMAAELNRHLGISPVNFWWTTTHTHSAPELGTPGMYKVFLKERSKHEIDTGYTIMVKKKLIEGIKEARQKLAPARLGAGWGFSQANINRRARDIDGITFLGLNPDGPVDRRIGLLRIEKEDGTLMALIANYPIHGTVMGQESVVISGDAPGVVAEYVEQETGAPLVFINGAAGNLAPIYTVYPSAEAGHLGQFRVMLGDRILEANKNISATTEEVVLHPGSLTVETPRKAGLGWPEGFDNYTRSAGKGTDLVRLPVRFLKINDDIAIWSAPVELFCEVSNEVRDSSPFPYTVYYGYTNGWMGYLLSEDEYKHEGYELKVSPFSPSAARDLTEAVVTYLKGELKNNVSGYKDSTLKTGKKAGK